MERRSSSRRARGEHGRELEGEVVLPRAFEFQQREWRVSRVAWAAMALVVLAGIAGAFGGGPLADGRASAADGSITVEYPRIMRNGVPEELRVEVRGGGERVPIAFDRRLIDALMIEHVTPPPAEVRNEADWVTYLFSSTDGQVAVIFDVQPRGVGRVTSRLRAAGAPVEIRQLVLP